MEGRFRPWSKGEVEQVVAAMRSVFELAPEGAVLAYVYGSFLRGPFYEDIDVALLLDDLPPGGQAPMALWQALDRCAPDGVEVDLRVLNETGPAFQYEVIHTGSCLYERSRGERSAFEDRAVLVWLDFKPRFEAMAAALRKGIRQRWGQVRDHTID